jgi:hypothetical protein
VWLNNSLTGKFTPPPVCDSEIEYAEVKGLSVSGQKILMWLFKVSTVVFFGQKKLEVRLINN